MKNIQLAREIEITEAVLEDHSKFLKKNDVIYCVGLLILLSSVFINGIIGNILCFLGLVSSVHSILRSIQEGIKIEQFLHKQNNRLLNTLQD